MKVLVLSDIHDHLTNLAWALSEAKKRNVDEVWSLGDTVSPFTLRALGEQSPAPVVAIFGNNEGDRARLAMVAQRLSGKLTLFPRDVAEVQRDGSWFFLSHYPDLAEDAALSGKYSAVFHGHTHQQRKETINGTLLVNPGEIAGVRSGKVSCAVVDLPDGDVTFLQKEV